MVHRQSSDDQYRPLTRRRLLTSAGALGIATFLAGCGGQSGPAVNTTGSPTTAQPTMDGGETTTATETTETETETATTTEAGSARLRVAHLSPNAPNVDVLVDGPVVLRDVPFGAVSDYLEVGAGAHTVEITASGNAETSVFEGEVEVDADTSYTVAVIGELGDEGDEAFRPLVLTDDDEPVDDGMARLRAVHASPDAPAVDITAGGTTLFDGVAFGESGSTEVPAGAYTVEVRGDTPGNDGEVVASFDVSLSDGRGYTAFAAGYLTPDDEPGDTPFDLIVVRDPRNS